MQRLRGPHRVCVDVHRPVAGNLADRVINPQRRRRHLPQLRRAVALPETRVVHRPHLRRHIAPPLGDVSGGVFRPPAIALQAQDEPRRRLPRRLIRRGEYLVHGRLIVQAARAAPGDDHVHPPGGRIDHLLARPGRPDHFARGKEHQLVRQHAATA